jgi:CheY-like chemotaxis protein
VLVRLHGGSMEAHSAGTGRGTSFRVRLPQASVRSASEAAAPGRGAAKGALRGRCVVIVEDHDETREAMQFVLERAGAQVRSAEDGQRALALLGADTEHTGERCLRVDVVVCDLGLPDMSGYEFITRLVQAYQQKQLTPPPACALSAHAREVDRQRAIRAGFDLHIAKPLNAEALIEAVTDLCQLAALPAAVNP